MIFQPSGGAGGGEGLTVYSGSLSRANKTVTFETPVKLVFVSHYTDIPLWFVFAPGESQNIYSTDTGDTWPPARLGDVSLSANGKTLSIRSDRYTYLYYALG